MKIILITGSAGSGKDTYALYLKKQFEKADKSVAILAFADVIKTTAKRNFNYKNKKGAGRTLLQEIGDRGRETKLNVWVYIIVQLIKTVYYNYDVCIITDCRMQNELEIIKQEFNNVELHRINRAYFKSKLSQKQQSHISEIDLNDVVADVNVDIGNCGLYL